MSAPEQYRKKPVVIEALRFDGRNGPDVAKWSGGYFVRQAVTHTQPEVRIPTLEGEMITSVGDYVIKGVKGEFYPCKPDIFEATYEQVSA